MNIVCTIDEAYVQHCGVMLCSLFENNPGVNCRVFLISDGLSGDARRKLLQVAETYRQQLEWRDIDPTSLGSVRVTDHISIATYFRILIPHLVPSDLDRVLFLDSDTIVRGALREFYEQPIDDVTHAAVANPFSDGDRERMGIPAVYRYFNAGVLLLNLRRWREERLMEQILEYIGVHAATLRWWDQDALNATLHSRWRSCPPTWNAQWAFFAGFTSDELGVSAAELGELRADPRIVHFTGTAKPWSYYNDHPFKRDYYTYLAKTPWAGFRPLDRPSAATRIKQQVKGLLETFR